MCAKCEKTSVKLEAFLTDLQTQPEFKGTDVEGTPVLDDHHISIGLLNALKSRETGRQVLDAVMRRALMALFGGGASQLRTTNEEQDGPAFPGAFSGVGN